jgi:HEAT repeat protein
MSCVSEIRSWSVIGAFCSLLACQSAWGQVASAEPSPLDAAFTTLRTLEWGPQRNVLLPIDTAAAACHSDPVAREALETRLIQVLQSNAGQPAKAYICEVLAAMGTARSVPALAALLNDAQTSHLGRRALESIRDPAAAQALRAALPQLPDNLKVGVIQSLANIRDTSSIDLFVNLLANPDTNVVRAAASGLGQIGDDRAAQALLDFYRQAPEETRLLATDACLSMARQRLAMNHLEAAAAIYRMLEDCPLSQVRWAAFQGLVAAEPAQAQTRLLNALNGSPDDSSAAGDRQRRMVAQLVRETARAETVSSYAQGLASLPIASQIVLLDALSSFSTPAVRTAALDCLTSEDLMLRLSAEKALAACGQVEDLSTLANMAANARDDVELQTTMRTLQELQAPKVDQELLTLVPTAAPSLQIVLIRTIANRQIPNAGSALIEVARSDDPRVRLEAYRALQSIADPVLVEQLVELLANTTNLEEREAVDRALWRSCLQINDPDQRASAVLARLQGADDATEVALLPALGRIGGTQALAVVQRATEHSNAAVREAGIRALTNWPDATVADQLWDIASQDQDAAHKIWALRALARVLPQLAREQPDQVATRLQAVMKLAEREEDKRLILSRLPAVRSEVALTLALSCLEQPALRADAVEATAELGEAMKDSHPQAARKALETIAPLTDNSEQAIHIQKILWNMQLKGR